MKLINLKDIPLVTVSHDPQILKQVMINTGVIPGLTKVPLILLILVVLKLFFLKRGKL